MSIITDIEGVWKKAETVESAIYVKAAGLVSKEAGLFEASLAASIKAEIPLITGPIFSTIKTMAAHACALAETEVKDVLNGDEKWTVALSHLLSGIGQLGLNPASLSKTTTDSLLQAGAMVLKNTGTAVFLTGNPTVSPSEPSASSAASSAAASSGTASTPSTPPKSS